jgi:murein DD-endopeptidase MepM/ murein hydrolase activator NlpD
LIARLISLLTLLIALAGLLLAGPSSVAAEPEAAGPVSIAYDFRWIRQGSVGVVRVTGADIADVRAVFQERVHPFYSDQGGFTGLIAADMEQDVGQYPLQVWVRYLDGTSERIDQTIEVNYGEFGRADVVLPVALMPLLERAVEDEELARLFNIFSRFTPERYWADEGFALASTATLIGPFGTWRLYNETTWRRHTGLDYRTPIGTPVTTAASGRVMFAGRLPIRGGYVLVDHGWGIYSGYAHLSELLVVPGQWVRKGDVIALSGINGRSAGAHLHWEMTVSGAWVNPEQFVGLNLGAE